MHRSRFNRRHFSSAALAGAAAAALGGATAHAATISFSAEGQFSNDSVLIDPSGIGDYAVGFGQTASLTTVSSSDGLGVTFQAGPPSGTTGGVYTQSTANVTLTAYDPSSNGTAKIPTSGSYLGTATNPTLATAQAAQANDQPAGTGDANFATIVGHGSYYSGSTANTTANGAGLLEVTLNNLVAGDLYNIQVFFVDDRSTGSSPGLSANIFNTSDIATATSGTGGTPPDATVLIGEYTNNTNNGTSVIGGYILGSFVADSTGSESFYTNNTTAAGAYSGGNIQALVLDNTGPAPVPEPASLGLTAIAATGLLRRRRARAHS